MVKLLLATGNVDADSKDGSSRDATIVGCHGEDTRPWSSCY